MKNSLIMLLFAFVFFLHGTASASVDSREIKRVLVLYSLEKGNMGQERMDAQLQTAFGSNKTFNIKIYNEYLDLVRFPEAKQISHLTQFLHQKYTREKPDVILTILPAALDIIEEHGKELFKGIPVIAACIPRDRAEALKGSQISKKATGIIYVDNAYEIAQSALRLRPGTKHIVFIAGVSVIDRSFKIPTLREIKRAAQGIELIDLSGLTIGEILSRVHTLPPETIVFNTSMFKDKEGVTFDPPDALKMVSQASNAPVFGFVETHMGKGIVGGRVASLQWQIDKLTEMTQRILAGESPTAIPIVEEAGYQTIYDWKELKRWSIPESSLPKGSILINKELNILERYKKYLFAGVVFLIVQSILIIFLIDMNRKKKKASAQLREFMDRYHELLRVDRSSRLGELTASLAHELNQPLGAILSNAQAALRFLASGKNDPELTREILQNIVQDDKRAADVIRSLRSMVKKGEIRREPTSINEVLNEVIEIAMGALVAQDMSIETFMDEKLPLVNADKTQIQQVALNLITNAMDAMTQSPPDKRKIFIKTELIEGFVRVAIHDYGPGIPAAQADKIFDPFYTTKSNGLGMGLAVCRSIITDHGGFIWAEKNPEGGEIFFFSLKAEDHD